MIWDALEVGSHWKVTSSTQAGSRTYVKGVGEDEGEDGWDLLWTVLEQMDDEGWDALLEEEGDVVIQGGQGQEEGEQLIDEELLA